MKKNSQKTLKDENLKRRPIMLCILDGWGEREGGDDNAIFHANTPNWDRMVATNPKTTLKASDLDVGLPNGQMGNSEVGHMNLGAGRIVLQDLPLINQSIEDNSIKDNPALTDLITKLNVRKSTCHLVGLVSPGGVHSHQDHMTTLAEILNSYDIPVKLHAFLDGRDTAQSGGKEFVQNVIDRTSQFSRFSIATIMGRYWAMDRDNNWDRIEQAYNAISEGAGVPSEGPLDAIQTSYNNGKTDEFMPPYIINNYRGINDGDGILIFNFRSDRARQITSCFVDPDFCNFKKERNINLAG